MVAVLIIEDEDEIRELLAEMLAERGFAVATARNGEEGLRALRSGPLPGIVLLDLLMPVMDGRKMRAEMLGDPALAGIPVIIMSGAADVQDGSDALAAAHVLIKPVKWPVLLESVEAHARGDRS